MESCSSCSIHISCCCVKIPKKVRSVVDRQTLIFFFFESVNSWSFLSLLTPAGNLPLLCICVCKYTVMHTHKHILTVSSWEDEWPEVELPVKDSLGTGSLAHAYTHILLFFGFFLVFLMFSTVWLCVYLVWAVTRPGHLRGIWGGVALCWKKRRWRSEACCCYERQEKENGVQCVIHRFEIWWNSAAPCVMTHFLSVPVLGWKAPLYCKFLLVMSRVTHLLLRFEEKYFSRQWFIIGPL